MFHYDSTGVNMEQNFTAAPEGFYGLVITKASDTKDNVPRITQKGDPYVSVECEIDDPAPYLGKKVWHNVTFLPKERTGAGMAIHFLKAIGEPWEGAFDVNPRSWIGKRFRAKLRVVKDNQGRPKNEIAWLVTDEKAEQDETPF